MQAGGVTPPFETGIEGPEIPSPEGPPPAGASRAAAGRRQAGREARKVVAKRAKGAVGGLTDADSPQGTPSPLPLLVGGAQWWRLGRRRQVSRSRFVGQRIGLGTEAAG